MGNINLPIDNTLIERIDTARGKQPRVSWIRDAISDKLGSQPMAIPHQVVEAAVCTHPNVPSPWTRICPDCQARLRD